MFQIDPHTSLHIVTSSHNQFRDRYFFSLQIAFENHLVFKQTTNELAFNVEKQVKIRHLTNSKICPFICIWIHLWRLTNERKMRFWLKFEWNLVSWGALLLNFRGIRSPLAWNLLSPFIYSIIWSSFPSTPSKPVRRRLAFQPKSHSPFIYSPSCLLNLRANSNLEHII